MSEITFGKYAGYTFEGLLKKDINYCKFIHACPVNDKTKDFKEFLTANLERFIIDKEREEIKQKLSSVIN